MGQSAEELRYEIADTRAELGQTLDAIGDRVSPGRMIERRKNRFVVGMRSAKDRIMGTATDAGHAVTEGAQGVGEGIADTAGSAVDTVRSAPQAARQQAQGNPVMAGAVAFGLGFLGILTEQRRRGWPDRRAKTLVFYADPEIDPGVSKAGHPTRPPR